MNGTGSYNHSVRHARKYMYDKFEFEIPEIVELFKDDAEKWVQEENADRKRQIAALQSPIDGDGKQKSKRQIKENAADLKDNFDDYYRPVTAKDYCDDGYGKHHIQLYIDQGTGKFEFEFCREMTVFDKLRGANKKLNEKLEKEAK